MSGRASTTSSADASVMIAPLRAVADVAVSEVSGTALNSRYFWLTWEYTLTLVCGHAQVRARCVYDGDPSPAKLRPALPARVRCTHCPPIRAIGKPRAPKPHPVFDPVVGALVAALCTAVPERQDEFLDWVDQHGRHMIELAARDRAYGAMALTVIDSYLPDTRNPHAAGVREAVARWAAEPTQAHRRQVRAAARRLYGAQRRDGDWYAHRGIIDATTLTSPAPHNIRAALTCPTWDNTTRSRFYNQMWALRGVHDAARGAATAAFLNGDTDGERGYTALAAVLRQETEQLARTDRPVLGAQHLDLATAMLATYQHALHPAPASRPGRPAETLA
jgi:hypothetical protein